MTGLHIYSQENIHTGITWPQWVHSSFPADSLMHLRSFPSLVLVTLQWRHNEQDSVSNHQPHNCLLSCLFRLGSNKTSKLRVTGLCAGNSPGTGEFPAQMASNAENVSIWCRHHDDLVSSRHQAHTRTNTGLLSIGTTKKWKLYHRISFFL